MRYTGKTIRVDIDTGEILTQHNAERNYTKIKVTKETKINYIQTRAYVTYTVKYRRKQQLELFTRTNT